MKSTFEQMLNLAAAATALATGLGIDPSAAPFVMAAIHIGLAITAGNRD